MLNVYLAPRSGRALPQALWASALAWLVQQQIIAPSGGGVGQDAPEPGQDAPESGQNAPESGQDAPESGQDAIELARAYVPGAAVRRLFHESVAERHLPAELTFDALQLVRTGAARFLPEAVEIFEQAQCPDCGDPLDAQVLADDLHRLLVFPIEQFRHLCPSCRRDLSLREIDFGQPTAIAQEWLLIEGLVTQRLSPNVLQHLQRLLGQPLVVVPELLEEAGFEAPAQKRGGAKRGRRRR